jgi:hypothetical protein
VLTEPERMSALRWFQFAVAAAVLVAGAAWMFIPSADNAVPPVMALHDDAADSHDHGSLPYGYVGPALPPPLELSSPEPTPAGPAPPRQYLAAMRTFAGPKNVQALPYGRTLSMACPSGRGTDLFREVRYNLRRSYATLTAHIVNLGSDDPKSTVRLHVLGTDGTIYRADLPPKRPASVHLGLAKSEYLRIRLFCTSPASRVELRDAVLAR